MRLLILTFLAILVTACYGADGGKHYYDSDPPNVSAMNPTNDTNFFIPERRNIYVYISDYHNLQSYSDSLDYSSVNSSTFFLEDELGNRVPGSIGIRNTRTWSNSNHYSAQFTASYDLMPDTRYTATVTSGIKDRHNNRLANPISWSFTTGPQGVGVWSNMSNLGAPPSGGVPAIWTGSEMLVWNSHCSCGGLYNPTTDSWRSMSTTDAPESTTGNISSSIIWSGSELIVWGGEQYQSGYSYHNTGARYNPATDTWTPITTTGAPDGRAYHVAVWTGTEMIIWGGYNGDYFVRNYLTSGARYNPTTDTWIPISTTNAPGTRTAAKTVWTGTEMIVWGGMRERPSFSTLYLNTGSRYNPLTDTWATMSQTNAPSARYGASMIWAGQELIIWGGKIYMENNTTELTNTGYRYDPTTDTWALLAQTNAPGARYDHLAFWTGSKMLIWGGTPLYGGLYDPTSNTWEATTTFNAPSSASVYKGAWTGTQMIVWGAGQTAFGETEYVGGIFEP